MKQEKFLEEPEDRESGEPYDGSDINLAGVNEYSLAHSESGARYVGTNGLGDCIGVAVYDSENEAGAVSHSIPRVENMKPSEDKLVKEMLSDMEEVYSSDSVSATIITSDLPSDYKLAQVNHTLEQSDIVEEEIKWVKLWDESIEDQGHIGSAALDTYNGSIKPLPYSDI